MHQRCQRAAARDEECRVHELKEDSLSNPARTRRCEARTWSAAAECRSPHAWHNLRQQSLTPDLLQAPSERELPASRPWRADDAPLAG